MITYYIILYAIIFLRSSVFNERPYSDCMVSFIIIIIIIIIIIKVFRLQRKAL